MRSSYLNWVSTVDLVNYEKRGQRPGLELRVFGGLGLRWGYDDP
jgi:hypothetical protein